MESTELIKKAMEKRNIKNPNQLSKALGCTRASAYKLVAGDTKPSYETTLKLLDMAGIVPSSLLGMSQNKVTYSEKSGSSKYNSMYIMLNWLSLKWQCKLFWWRIQSII